MAVKLEQIIRETANVCGVTIAQILGNDRSPDVLTACQLAMYVARKQTTRSLPEIAAAFGKTHAIVIHATRNIEKRLGAENELQGKLKALLEILRLHEDCVSEKKQELLSFRHGQSGVVIRVIGDPNAITLTTRSRKKEIEIEIGPN